MAPTPLELLVGSSAWQRGFASSPPPLFYSFFPLKCPARIRIGGRVSGVYSFFPPLFLSSPFTGKGEKKKEQFPRSLWLHGDAPARLRLPLGFVLLTLVGSARGAWLPALSPPLPPAVPGRGPRLGDVWGEEGSGVPAVQRGSFIPVPAPGLLPRPAASSVPPASPSCCSGSRRI